MNGTGQVLFEPGFECRCQELEELEELLEQLAVRLPVGRVGVPDDVARVVVFCASDLAMFMTGSTLAVDGGDLAL